jgi:WD40 repeat protein
MAYVDELRRGIHGDVVKSLDVRGVRLATGGGDNVAHCFSLGRPRGSSAEGELRLDATFAGHADIVNSARLSPDGGRVATGSKDHRVRVWDVASGSGAEVGRHDSWVMSVAWNDDGSSVVSGSEDGTVRVWDAAGGEMRRIDLGYPGNAVDWRGERIAVANGNRKLYVLDPATGEILREVRGAEQLLWSVAFSPDGLRVAWAGRDRAIRVLELERGETFSIPAHEAQVWSVSWDELGERLISASADGTAAVWTSAGAPVDRIRCESWVRAARFVGGRVALVGEDGRLRILRDDGIAAEPPEPVAVPSPPRACAHWAPRVLETSKTRCDECDSVESLRLCVTCGHVGCCESQRAHGTKHWEATRHPNTIPTPRGSFPWKWCYADDIYVKRVARSGRTRVA